MRFVIGLVIGAGLVFGGIWYWANRDAWKANAEDDKSGTHAPAAPTPPAPPKDDDAEKAAELVKQAKVAAKDNLPRARALYEQAAKEYPDTWGGREANLQLGDLYFKAGLKKEAVEAYRKGFPNATEAQQAVLLDQIRRIEEELAKTPASGTPKTAETTTPPPPPGEEDTVYAVVKGDTLTSISRKFNVSIEQIKLANRKADDKLAINDRLTISRQMPTISVNKKTLKLTLTYKGATVKEYPVCIGKEAELTPAGDYTVGAKLKNPDWFQPGGKKVPYGDPENILGTRWMTLVPADGVPRGYGMHGTTKPETVPGRASAGCIRMLNPDVEQLYEWVPTGAKVTITEE